jgi:serine/threonine protein kinase
MTWVLALLLIFVAVFVESRSGANQPLVAVFVFAGFLATRLPWNQFLVLVAVIGITLLAPMYWGINGSEQLWRRMIGLICLTIMALYQGCATRRVTKVRPLPTQPTADNGELTEFTSQIAHDVDTWRASVADSGSYHPSLIDAEWLSGGDSTTRLRKSQNEGFHDSDSLSMEATPSDDRFQPIIDHLNQCGDFTPDQVIKIGETLRSLDLSPKDNGISPLVLFQGQQVGSFKIDMPLGRGGEGTVYRGFDDHGNTAAIKILHNMRVSDRFRREMQMVRELAHRNIVTAYEVGEFQGLPFISMELLKGPDLNQQVKRNGELNWRTSTKYVMQIAHALSHAHERELVHRDVKPANILQDGHGGVKLVDLGLAAKASHDEGVHSVFQFVTQDGQLAGTLPFMAPEQAKALRHATQQSDIYSLGASWFYMLEARGRLQGSTFEAQMHNLIINRQFHELKHGALPERLMRVYQRMTAYDVEDRYADCEQLIQDLSDALIDLGEEVVLSNDVNVLIVEDSKADMILTLNLLRRANASVKIHQAASLSDALAVCKQQHIDMVLLDLTLPDSSGIDTIVNFRTHCKDVPLVVLTGMSEDQAGADSMRAGADMFVSKQELTVRRMERIIFVTLSRCDALVRPATN